MVSHRARFAQGFADADLSQQTIREVMGKASLMHHHSTNVKPIVRTSFLLLTPSFTSTPKLPLMNLRLRGANKQIIFFLKQLREGDNVV